jgi:hypothetical protein
MPLEGRSRRRSQRSHDAREPLARSGEERPADDVQLVLALQRMAGNQAVARSATLHRKVKIGKTTLTAAPAVPPVVLKESGLKAAALKAEATKWVNDKVTDKSRTFTDDEHFYRTVAKSVASASAASEDARWTILGKAAKKNGKVTEVKWSTFNSVEGPLLLAELTACTIQLSSNSDTTAAHGNAHGKLPKKGLGENLKKLSAGDQCDKTPYFEFLVAGQSASGITRGVFDKDDGRVYLTAHYDEGSFVWLTGAPAALVADWNTKVAAFIKIQKGQ